ncbi:MAG: alpha/beta hydrolase [Pyrinomonadaceae bacterium]
MEAENLIRIGNDSIFYKTIKVNGDENSGILIFLHDALGSTEQWRDFPALLAEKTGLDAIVYDRPGYGRSSPATSERTGKYLRQEAERVLPAFLEKLGIEKPFLFGHSDGGTIALLYAARHPARAIICEAAHVLVEEETIAGIRHAGEQKDVLVEKLAKYHGAKNAARLFDEWQRVWLSDDFRQWNVEAELGKIECPALLFQGLGDEYATTGHLARIAEGIGQKARPVLLENCGHLPHHDAPEEVIEQTAEFLEDVNG